MKYYGTTRYYTLAGYLSFLNWISLPIIFSVSDISGQLLGGITAVIHNAPEYYALSTLVKKFNTSTEHVSTTEQKTPIQLSQSIHLDDVVVSYPDKTVSLPNMTFETGKKYLVTGESGSGKSTLLRLLNGDLRTYSGNMTWDDKTYHQLSTETIKRSIVTMSQHTHVFNRSIKENIILEEKYDALRLQTIIRQVHLDTVINQLEHGIETMIDAENLT